MSGLAKYAGHPDINISIKAYEAFYFLAKNGMITVPKYTEKDLSIFKESKYGKDKQKQLAL